MTPIEVKHLAQGHTSMSGGGEIKTQVGVNLKVVSPTEAHYASLPLSYLITFKLSMHYI